MPSFYEFFAGGGMARAGLGDGWTCLFANDIDEKKAAAYAANQSSEHLRVGSVGDLSAADLPGRADLAWASFPCQDLSLAGDLAGLKGARSGTFWLFWRLMQRLAEDDRLPAVVVLENVCGALSSHEGRDFGAICRALRQAGYRFGAVVVDAVHFVPQSRPRLFIIGARECVALPSSVVADGPVAVWHPGSLVKAFERLPQSSQSAWVWWALPSPPSCTLALSDLVEDASRVRWHTPSETRRLLSLMSESNRAKVEEASRAGRRMVGCLYRRTRRDREGNRIQRAEVRFDIAGCLRTPAGGSSRQILLVVEGTRIRSRLIAAREAARLMGLPDTYRLPENYNEAYHLVGDGVVVPAVRFLAANLLEPLLEGGTERDREAA